MARTVCGRRSGPWPGGSAALCVLAAILGGPGTPRASAAAAGAHVAPALAAPSVQVSARAEGGHVLTASFTVAATPEVAWQVLTDYEGLPRFVRSLSQSIVVGRDQDTVHVAQEGTGRFGFVSRRVHVVLAIQQPSPDRLEFRDTCTRSFHAYRGSWSVQPSGSGAVVTYRLEARPRFFAPGLVAGRAARGNVAALLEDVRSEMERRARIALR